MAKTIVLAYKGNEIRIQMTDNTELQLNPVKCENETRWRLMIQENIDGIYVDIFNDFIYFFSDIRIVNSDELAEEDTI